MYNIAPQKKHQATKAYRGHGSTDLHIPELGTTNQLTISTEEIFLEKLVGARLKKKFPIPYKIRSFITMSQKNPVQIREH
jgi:hypothetical protein